MKNKYQLKDSASVYILAILVPIITAFILSIALGFIAQSLNMETEALLSNMWVYSLILLISQGSFLAVVLIYNKKKNICTLQATTVNKKVGIKNYIVVAIMAVASLFLFLPIINWFDALIRTWGYSNSGELPFAINNVTSLIVALLSMALLPAICEEFVFRGVIYNGIKNSMGAKKAIILSSLCFCIMHMSLQQTIYPLLLGIIFGLILHYTGSLRATIFAHFCNNAIVVVSNYFASFAEASEAVEYKINVTNTISAFIWFFIACSVIALLCKALKLINKTNNKTENIETETTEVVIENNLSENLENVTENSLQTTETENLKADKNMLWIYLAVSIVMWIIENIAYFVG